MNALTNSHEIRPFQGFAVHVLRSDAVEVAIVPELGAKIISLKNMRTGREWLWHPPVELRLFKNLPGDDFCTSPLAGMDECLPTIAPCHWRGRRLPDHGEVWHQPWQCQETDGVLTATVALPVSPFAFKRTVELCGHEVRLSYELASRADAEEPFAWATHPLLRLMPGDRLQLPASTRAKFAGHSWIDAVASAVPPGQCAKIFASDITEGWAAIENEKAADRLEFVWNPAENPFLGLWLTRGGWHGHHHFAIEPTNASDDSLVTAASRKQCGTVPAHGAVTWQLLIRVGS